jgi:hypothetical protein
MDDVRVLRTRAAAFRRLAQATGDRALRANLDELAQRFEAAARTLPHGLDAPMAAAAE